MKEQEERLWKYKGAYDPKEHTIRRSIRSEGAQRYVGRSTLFFKASAHLLLVSRNALTQGT